MSTQQNPTEVTYNLADLWEALTDAGPDAECLVVGQHRHSRRSYDDRANQVAHALLARGVGRGDHVGVYSYNRVEFLEAMMGCFKIGAVPVNINYRYVAEELRYVMTDADLVAMVVERTFVPLLDELAPEFPAVGAYLVIEDGSDHRATTFSAESWDEVLDAASTGRDFGVERTSDDLYLLYTGGTTGMPKGVMWRHEDIFYAAFGGGNYYDPIAAPADIAKNATEPGLAMTPLALAPLMHGGGQWISFIGLYSGGRAIVYAERSFDADKILSIIEAERPLTMALVGDAMARPLAEAMIAGNYDCSGLASVGNGGAMLSKPVRAQLAEAFPNALITDAYGATETGAAGTQIEQEGYTEGPKFAIGEHTSVLNPDTLEPCAVGERGMLAKSGNIPLGYYKDEVKSAATFKTDARGKRWVVPGDFAALDEEGRLVLFGRGSVSINSGGEKIYPEEVESSIRSHPDVYDALVCGVADPRWGQRVVALVQLRENAAELSIDDLQAHCRDHIAGYKLPRELILTPVQRTNVGKPDYVWAKKHAEATLGTD